MRRFLLLLMAVPALLWACTADDLPPQRQGSEESGDTHYVSLEEARGEVERLLEGIDGETRSAARRIGESFTYGGEATRSGDGSTEPVYHIFNFENGEGFAIASGDDRTPPVMCITDSGSFTAGMELDNPGAAMAVSSYDTAYRVTAGLPVNDFNGGLINPGDPGYPDGFGFGDPFNPGSGGPVVPGGIVIDDGTGPKTFKTYGWVFASSGGPLLACVWGQDDPYHDLMPTINGEKVKAGCGAVAVAQVLYHYGYPSSIGGYPLDWTLLRRHIHTENTASGAPAVVARLFQQLNTKSYLDSSVGVDGTSTLTKRIAPAFRKLGLQCADETDYNPSDMIRAVKTDRRPVIVFGYSFRLPVNVLGIRVDYKYEDGHFWVCDRVMTYSRKTEAYNSGGKLVSTTYQYAHYVHCNWGWDGRWNGYFFPEVFDAMHEPDPPTRSSREGESNFYRYNLKMWHQIRRQ